jgi:hypothetical protein
LWFVIDEYALYVLYIEDILVIIIAIILPLIYNSFGIEVSFDIQVFIRFQVEGMKTTLGLGARGFQVFKGLETLF